MNMLQPCYESVAPKYTVTMNMLQPCYESVAPKYTVTMNMLQPCYESVAPKYTGRPCSSSTVAVMNFLLCVQGHLAHQWHCDQGAWGHPVAGRWDICQRPQLLAGWCHCQQQEWRWQCHLLLLWWVSHLLCLLCLLLMMVMTFLPCLFHLYCLVGRSR